MASDPGQYIVVEVAKAGWTESFPGGSDIVAATGTGLGDFGYAIAFTSGETESGNNFGNFRQATKSGIKFNDLNGAGAGTTGPGLSGWTIEEIGRASGRGRVSKGEVAAGPEAT